MPPFVDFETDPDQPGVHWDSFVSALAIWVYMQDAPPTVEAATNAFNTTPGAIRKAVMEHPWLIDMWSADETDPAKQIIESDGE
jgi:hypothetical protein